ncbi:hypothetical protein [Piscinibacter koreensis]|uniref:Uncharacterized protein n=1 Tax=Piscinibacter koreensis TaxID=2742824 RepID=A0A7Y6NS48_9BURK|nr:hypothetical protein [Schlegelella koreensis]NUZ08293.1 hypothetical protein [Schlegelella koreensis]
MAEFIDQDREQIPGERESFAATLPPSARGLDSKVLRDDPSQILDAGVLDLKPPRTAEQADERPQGRAVQARATDERCSRSCRGRQPHDAPGRRGQGGAASGRLSLT